MIIFSGPLFSLCKRNAVAFSGQDVFEGEKQRAAPAFATQTMPRVKSVDQILAQLKAVNEQLLLEQAKLEEQTTERNLKIAFLEQKMKVLRHEANRPRNKKIPPELIGKVHVDIDSARGKEIMREIEKENQAAEEQEELAERQQSEASGSQAEDVVHASPPRAAEEQDDAMDVEGDEEAAGLAPEEHPAEPPAGEAEPAADRPAKPKRGRKRKQQQPAGDTEGHGEEASETPTPAAEEEPKPKRARGSRGRAKGSAGDVADGQGGAAAGAGAVGGAGPVPPAGSPPVNDTEEHVEAEKFRSEARNVADAAQAAAQAEASGAQIGETDGQDFTVSFSSAAGTAGSLYERMNRMPVVPKKQLMEEVLQTGQDVSFFAKIIGL